MGECIKKTEKGNGLSLEEKEGRGLKQGSPNRKDSWVWRESFFLSLLPPGPLLTWAQVLKWQGVESSFTVRNAFWSVGAELCCQRRQCPPCPSSEEGKGVLCVLAAQWPSPFFSEPASPAFWWLPRGPQGPPFLQEASFCLGTVSPHEVVWTPSAEARGWEYITQWVLGDWPAMTMMCSCKIPYCNHEESFWSNQWRAKGRIERSWGYPSDVCFWAETSQSFSANSDFKTKLWNSQNTFTCYLEYFGN